MFSSTRSTVNLIQPNRILIPNTFLLVIFCLSLTSCSEPESVGTPNQAIAGSITEPVPQDQAADETPKTYRTIEWIELMPADDLEALLNPPEFLGEIADGSDEDLIDSKLQLDTSSVGDSPYEQALVSTRVIEAMNNQAIRIPAFVVPLDFDDTMVTKEFFLVPFFGACIHVPPPPPNQIIYVKHPNGVQLSSLYDVFWFSGTLIAELNTNDTATAAYTLQIDQIEPYLD
ncbi:DUF3299 domain-containing protein [Corallincola spongiicola]|uniref:DUF3299 domain-containing protein n=1 Tax=Corallincola spongiicola TaxID=2520508 RepID=A0ABY1WP59_9GAMM|nr:DUF3299 domain-containing protein [Corallincola spongiicola]